MTKLTRQELPQGIILHERYRVERLLGAGGFGITYLCRDERLQRMVCIKEFFLSGHCTRGSGQTVITQGLNAGDFAHFRARFSEEARALARFRHPGIVQVLDVFEEHNTAYYAMDYVEGETLKALVQRKGPLPMTEAMPFMHKLLDAVETVHASDMLHRDIKPENIMVRADGQPVLIDFGSARQFSEGKTLSQTAILTPGYAPPEQYSDRTRRGTFSDIYALGATFYFMLTGKKPMAAVDRQWEELPAPHQVLPGISKVLSSAIMLALNLKPEDRFQTIGEFRAALSSAEKAPIQEENTGKTNPDYTKQKRSKNPSTKAVLLVLIVILGVVWFKFGNQPSGGIQKNADTVDYTQLPPPVDSTKRDSEAAPREVKINEPEVPNHSPESTIEQTDELPTVIQRLQSNMVYVAGGTFTMGCTFEQGGDCDNDDRPVHQVTVSSFQMGKYEVTQAEWEAVMGNKPSEFQNCPSCPVENVSWNDVQDFIRKLNNATGGNYRLPTEAEWEFAARGGNRSSGTKYSGSDYLGSVAWYGDNSGGSTHQVGQKQANVLGLHDMSGNLREWCNDWYGAYSSGAQTNPRGPSSGADRVLRGGGWNDDAQYCRVSNRFFLPPGYRFLIGFRLVSPGS